MDMSSMRPRKASINWGHIRRLVLVMKRVGRWPLGGLVILMIVMSCCSSDDISESSSQPEDEGGAMSFRSDVIPNVFASMWDYDEVASFHNAKVEGILLIDEPCVYVVDDYAWLYPGTPLEELPDPVRIFVNLPRGQTRYDTDTQLVWINEYGPFTSGDRIEVVGGGINPRLPAVCSADTDRAFNVKRVNFKRCSIWFPTDHPNQIGCHPSVSDPLAGMWYFDEEIPHPGNRAEGILLLEESCVYIIDISPKKWPKSERVFLKLPRRYTKYDADTHSVHVHEYGPMTNGDRVELIGVYRSTEHSGLPRHQLPPDMCSADVKSMFTASYMSPKRCEFPWSSEDQTQGGGSIGSGCRGDWLLKR